MTAEFEDPKYEKMTFRVFCEGRAYSGPMNIADAHNRACDLQQSEDLPIGGLVEVIETFEFGCVKCGDDHFTTVEAKRPSGRWRCNACVWGRL